MEGREECRKVKLFLHLAVGLFISCALRRQIVKNVHPWPVYLGSHAQLKSFCVITFLNDCKVYLLCTGGCPFNRARTFSQT